MMVAQTAPDDLIVRRLELLLGAPSYWVMREVAQARLESQASPVRPAKAKIATRPIIIKRATHKPVLRKK